MAGNNYGFKIMGRDGVSLNGKWPIFGFDVENIQGAFRTTRITDSSNNPFYNSGITPVSNSEMTYMQAGDHTYGDGRKFLEGSVKKLMARYEHGYDYKPTGYYTISGLFRYSISYSITRTGSGDYYQEFYGGDGSWTGNFSKTVSGTADQLYPTMNDFAPYGLLTDQVANYYPLVATYGPRAASSPDILVQGGTRGDPFSGNGILPIGNQAVAPAAFVTVEIDSKYVNIYMNYRWWDEIRRKNDFFDPSPYPSQWIFEVSERYRLVAQTTGSVFDVNVYLTPHKLEEMIING